VSDILVIERSAADAAGRPSGRLLEVDDLRVEFRTRDGVAKVINGVTYHVDAGETLAVLGESGSGKSVTAQTIMGILDTPPGFVTGGQVRFHGKDMLTMSGEQRRRIRGEGIAMVFQDALSALNPVFTIGFQIGEQFRIRRGMSRSDAKKRTIEMLDQVQIPNAKGRVNNYPHQFSGGMRQRVMIAMSLALDPEVLIADEPTTALDVTVQAQIMDLLAEQQRERQMGLILITHDLGVVAEVADRISVMYAGRVVEHGTATEVFESPAHPYTRGLLDSMPKLLGGGDRLYAIPGLPPNLTAVPPGCPFAPRCPRAEDICRHDPPPPTIELWSRRTSDCHFAEEVIAHGVAR
jgi:oligopeptide transport system ATP-binding protein